jgi:hypothetical protein
MSLYETKLSDKTQPVFLYITVYLVFRREEEENKGKKRKTVESKYKQNIQFSLIVNAVVNFVVDWPFYLTTFRRVH